VQSQIKTRETKLELVSMSNRFHGRVKAFFMDRNSGYITELGETNTTSTENVVTDRDVYFRISDMRVLDPRAILRKAVTGEILEYERQTDSQGRHRAYDITNLYETPLICEEGLVVFKRYHDIQREALRREGQRAINGYLAKNSGDRGPSKRNRHHGGGGNTPTQTYEHYTQDAVYRDEEDQAYESGDGAVSEADLE